MEGNEDTAENASIVMPDVDKPIAEVQSNVESSPTNSTSGSNTAKISQALPILHYNGIVSLDLSRMNLKQIPCNLDEIKVVQHLYLEGNNLEELPQYLFPTLSNLKWLDVRNNKLTTLPKDIAYHSNLETLLLQGNKITALPLELGLVANLKGIQLQGNPVTYPPPNVLAQGVQKVLTFLREELEIQSPSNIRPIAEPFYQNTKQKDSRRKSRKYKSMSCSNMNSRRLASSPERYFTSKGTPLTCVGSAKPLLTNNKSRPKSHIYIKYETKESGTGDSVDDYGLGDLKRTDLPEEEKWMIKEILSAQLPKDNVYEKKMAKREAKLRQRYARDVLMTKLRDMLDVQAKTLQRKRDQNVLKEWRLDYQKKKMNIKHKEFTISTPYDTNPNLVFDGTEKPRPTKTVEKLRDISEEMADIFISLKNMSESKLEENLSPRTKQKALDSEMKQLAQLQKKLEIIKCRNAKEDAISKISERNTRMWQNVAHAAQKNSK